MYERTPARPRFLVLLLLLVLLWNLRDARPETPADRDHPFARARPTYHSPEQDQDQEQDQEKHAVAKRRS